MASLNTLTATYGVTRFITEKASWLAANPMPGQPAVLKKRTRRIYYQSLLYKNGTHAAAEALVAALAADPAYEDAEMIEIGKDKYNVRATKVTTGAWSAWE